MIGETIVALICVQIIITWILAMAVASLCQRIAHLERIIARTHGYTTNDEEAAFGAH